MSVKGFINRHHRFLFYSTWLLLTIIQACFTQLQEDEAYYWIYSKFLAWGYFDHPPMVAISIRAGTLIFNDELGVRLVFVLFNLGTLFITEKLIDNKKPYLFYAIAFSLGILQLGGFLAVPDIPLIFFTCVFLLAYKKYLLQPSWLNVLFLILASACMMYSKYHALLIFFFVLLSNLKLLKDYRLYVAALLIILLYFPHLSWQYRHHWVTFYYQLFERNNKYQLNFTTDYLLSQLLITGPLAGFILWPAVFKYRPVNTFEKSLKWIITGTIVFFLFSTYKGRVEANWTAPALVPIIIIGHRFLSEHDRWRKWLIRLLPYSLLLICIVRVITIVNIVPVQGIIDHYFTWKDWVQKQRSVTANKPTVFLNSYSRAAEYWFYSGRETFSLNNYYDRQNNFAYWPVEDSLLGKDVYIFDIYSRDFLPEKIQTPLGTVWFGSVNNYHSFVKISVTPSKDKYSITEKDSLPLLINTAIPPFYLNYLKLHPEVNEDIKLGVFKGIGHYRRDIPCSITLKDLITRTAQTIKVLPNLPPGNYSLLFAINSNGGMYTANSRKIKLTVRPASR